MAPGVQIGYLPPAMIDDQGHLVVSSKGLASKGLAFRPDAAENVDDLLLRVARGLQVDRKISEVFVAELAAEQPIFVLGEVFGAGVQDLAYGAKPDANGTPGFRVFNIHVRPAGPGELPRRRGAGAGLRGAGAAAGAGAVPRALLARGDAGVHGRQGSGSRARAFTSARASWCGPASSGATRSSGGCSSRACRRSTCCARAAPSTTEREAVGVPAASRFLCCDLSSLPGCCGGGCWRWVPVPRDRCRRARARVRAGPTRARARG